MSPNTSRRNNQTKNNNDIKSLRALYHSYLSTLLELFPEWSVEDLLFVMDECKGDLDLAINRISEGHATQWGQVKSKKTKIPLVQQPQQQQKKIYHKGEIRAQQKSKNTNRYHKGRNNRLQNEPTKEKSEEHKPSWASILRGPSKDTEPEQEKTEVSIIEGSSPEVNVHDDITSEIEELEVKEIITVENEVIITREPTSDDTPSINNPMNESIHTPMNESIHTPVNESIHTPMNDTIHASVRKVNTIRRLNQIEPVVLPNNQVDFMNLKVQFGSLNLSNHDDIIEDNTIDTVENVRTEIAEDMSPVLTTAAVPIPTSPVLDTPPVLTNTIDISPPVLTNTTDISPPVLTNTIDISPPVLTNAAIHITPPILSSNSALTGMNKIQPIQHNSIPPITMDQNNPYVSYTPHSGFNGPEYATNDIQRMAYYDPSTYGQSPSTVTRDKYIPPKEGVHNPPQYNNMPYYSYYYLPNQYPNYQPAMGYQPYPNKNMFPIYGKLSNTPYDYSTPYEETLHHPHVAYDKPQLYYNHNPPTQNVPKNDVNYKEPQPMNTYPYQPHLYHHQQYPYTQPNNYIPPNNNTNIKQPYWHQT